MKMIWKYSACWNNWILHSTFFFFNLPRVSSHYLLSLFFIFCYFAYLQYLGYLHVFFHYPYQAFAFVKVCFLFVRHCESIGYPSRLSDRWSCLVAPASISLHWERGMLPANLFFPPLFFKLVRWHAFSKTR